MAAYDLDARYRTGSDPALLTGVQAIARFLVEQRALDQRSGRDIGFFVSGYQGSPLGGVDKMLLGMPDVLRENAIHFQPGLNEELAATSVWGSQIELPGGFTGRDGVVGVWYGKGPGVDRATDALRHMAMYGVHPRGGVVLLVGDDPAAKSSTVPAVSERSLAALGIPVLLPRNAEEVVTFGLHAVALSRACGTPVALNSYKNASGPTGLPPSLPTSSHGVRTRSVLRSRSESSSSSRPSTSVSTGRGAVFLRPSARWGWWPSRAVTGG